jgi:hypothetical protein
MVFIFFRNNSTNYLLGNKEFRGKIKKAGG